MIAVLRDGLKRGERFLKKTLSTTILRPFRHSCEHWRVGIRRSKTPLYEEGPEGLPAFKWISSPRGHFYADPMLFQQEGRIWLFVEDYQYATNDARSVLAAEVTENGAVGPFVPVLTTPYHLSYPLVFRHGRDIFMLPETAANRTVELYRAVQFPSEWRLEKVLYPHPAYDTTPLYHDGLWWFFATVPEGGAKDNLRTHLYFAESLTGEWRRHPANPIGRPFDGRGAGPILRSDDRLIRPTQCSRPVYGYSFSFDEIVELNPERFVERRLSTFEPTWKRHLRGMHNYARVGSIEVIDGCWGENPYVVM